jgi:hypothetical protein
MHKQPKPHSLQSLNTPHQTSLTPVSQYSPPNLSHSSLSILPSKALSLQCLNTPHKTSLTPVSQYSPPNLSHSSLSILPTKPLSLQSLNTPHKTTLTPVSQYSPPNLSHSSLSILPTKPLSLQSLNTHHQTPTNQIPTPNVATFTPPTDIRATEIYGGVLELRQLQMLSVRSGKQKQCKALCAVLLSHTGYGNVCFFSQVMTNDAHCLSYAISSQQMSCKNKQLGSVRGTAEWVGLIVW